MKKYYLVKCEHEVYCQGYEYVTDTFLVYAADFQRACWTLAMEKINPRNFVNMTVE